MFNKGMPAPPAFLLFYGDTNIIDVIVSCPALSHDYAVQ